MKKITFKHEASDFKLVVEVNNKAKKAEAAGEKATKNHQQAVANIAAKYLKQISDQLARIEDEPTDRLELTELIGKAVIQDDNLFVITNMVSDVTTSILSEIIFNIKMICQEMYAEISQYLKDNNLVEKEQ